MGHSMVVTENDNKQKIVTIMKWFSENEFKCKCCGELPEDVAGNVRALVKEVLDPLREKYGKPIRVNSGYRCKHHNLEVGGAVKSQHMAGEAADITCSDNAALEKIIREQGRFDQLIIYPTFLHVSWKRYGPNRKQVLRKKSNGYEKV